MPPRKKVTNDNGEVEGGAFRWTLENERKLLVLTQGRYLTGEDYERLVGVFPGTNLNGVKIKVSRFRVEQRKLYDEYGWALPDGGAKLKGPATPRKKRTADEDSESGEQTSSKKPRAKKSKKKAPAKNDVEDQDTGDENGNVKQEMLGDAEV